MAWTTRRHKPPEGRLSRFAVQIGSLSWPLKDGGVARTITAQITADGITGRGEAVPVAIQGGTIEFSLQEIKEVAAVMERGLKRDELNEIFPAGAARNALDSAMWDHAARQAGQSVWDLVGMKRPARVQSIARLAPGTEPHDNLSGASAIRFVAMPEDIEAQLSTLRRINPTAPLLVDADMRWSLEALRDLDPLLAERGVAMLMRPFTRYEDDQLEGATLKTTICADEACNTRADLERVQRRYGAICMSLDKAGGLSETLPLLRDAQEAGLKVLLECALASSLAAAPLLPNVPLADFVDLTPLKRLAKDDPAGLRFEDALKVSTDTRGLWGEAGTDTAVAERD